ncbi:zinc finger protein 771-like [Aricia agestis]|uniref:zinc finger protein 771-like n=1 Tax=Aricia agestis TaxID=91739 RepID=UPI001C207527|nr:zinc finger protein 771-like [Aricia agestis]XP_041983782.1 zinc finger protein 771-like [Aricia agestis]XP_041983783.1 zinc finger protein 771-like [Aricia agestis]
MNRTIRLVNVVPVTKIKKELSDNEEDEVTCKVCAKGFASEVALNNHARNEHIDEYISGEDLCNRPRKRKRQTLTKAEEEAMEIKKQEVLSSMEPADLTALASKEVDYILIKADDDPDEPKRRSKEKSGTKAKAPKTPRQNSKANVVPLPITGPFECVMPSTQAPEGLCHQIFLSCCEYSLHHRDEHTRRRKCNRCQVCEKPLSSGYSESPFPCLVCGMGFESNKELTAHTNVAHIKLKPYQCSICSKRFTQQGGLQQHMRMHTGERPHACTFCPKTFTQKSGMEQHLRIHTKVRPYRCVICEKTFCQSVHLQQHMRTHTNVAPFECGICQKRFKQSSHLNYHLKNHNPFNMTEEQKKKYAGLLGMIEKNLVEVEVEALEQDVTSQQVDNELNLKQEDIIHLEGGETYVFEENGETVWCETVEAE